MYESVAKNVQILKMWLCSYVWIFLYEILFSKNLHITGWFSRVTVIYVYLIHMMPNLSSSLATRYCCYIVVVKIKSSSFPDHEKYNVGFSTDEKVFYMNPPINDKNIV